MLRNRKKLFASLLILISLGVIGWFVLFEYSVRKLENRLEILAIDLRQKGYVVSYSNVEITGNPLFVKAVFRNPHIKDPKGFFEWQGQEVDITMRPWEFNTLHCRFPGDQKVSVPQNTPIPLGVLSLEGAKGVLALRPKGAFEEVTFMVDRITSLIGDQPQPLFLQASSLKVANLVDPMNSQVAFTTQLMNLEVFLKEAPSRHPLTVNLEAALSGFQSNKPFPRSLAEWRDGGGILDVNLLEFIWPPIRAEVEGTLTLDKKMYPLGSFSSRIQGYHEALTYMVQFGWMKKKNASAASFMLDLFSSADGENGKRLTVPITLQNKTFSVGPAPLFKLHPVGGS